MRYIDLKGVIALYKKKVFKEISVSSIDYLVKKELQQPIKIENHGFNSLSANFKKELLKPTDLIKSNKNKEYKLYFISRID